MLLLLHRENKGGDKMEFKDFGHGITVDSDAMTGVVRVNNKVVKKFKGETAWMDAERYATDLMLKVVYA
jgi:hypothetical protein